MYHAKPLFSFLCNCIGCESYDARNSMDCLFWYHTTKDWCVMRWGGRGTVKLGFRHYLRHQKMKIMLSALRRQKVISKFCGVWGNICRLTARLYSCLSHRHTLRKLKTECTAGCGASRIKHYYLNLFSRWFLGLRSFNLISSKVAHIFEPRSKFNALTGDCLNILRQRRRHSNRTHWLRPERIQRW